MPVQHTIHSAGTHCAPWYPPNRQSAWARSLAYTFRSSLSSCFFCGQLLALQHLLWQNVEVILGACYGSPQGNRYCRALILQTFKSYKWPVIQTSFPTWKNPTSQKWCWRKTSQQFFPSSCLQWFGNHCAVGFEGQGGNTVHQTTAYALYLL